MKQILLVTGALALSLSGTAMAKPGNGPGYGKGNNPGMSHKGHHAGMSAAEHAAMSQGVVNGQGYGVGGCPPGLAKKAVPCVPPGQVKKLYGVGQPVATNQALMGYNQLPYNLRTAYGPQLNPYGQYMMGNGYLYGVDPKTMIVTQVLNSVLGAR